MTAKGAHVMEKIRDETVCCICTETFVDPRVLPCLHTFCLKCLETNAAVLRIGPRQLMPCPVCRKEFNIPDSGLAVLQKNFLVERLIDIVKAPNSGTSKSTGIPCEACLEEVDPCLSTAVQPAEVYCADCQQKLCNECSVHHRKNKMTKLHNISRLDDDFKVKLKNCVKRCCREHWSDIFVYCLDCMDDFCPRCSVLVHNLHQSSSRGKIIDEYSELVDAIVNEFMDVENNAQKVKEEVEKKEDACIKKMDFLAKLVTERSVKIKKLVDSHTQLLHDEIKSKRQKMLEDIKFEKEQLEKLQASVIGYREDCTERKEFLTIEAVILTMKSLKAKAQELTQLREAFFNHFDSDLVEVALKESDIDDFLGKTNVIGQVEDTRGNLQESARNLNVIQTIMTRASTDDSKAVRGITVLGNELFVVHEESTDLFVYAARTFEYITDLKVSELNDPRDIASCKSNKCLYIFDRDHDDGPYRIFCLDTVGCIIRQWTTGKSDGSLSIAYDSNVIVANRNGNILTEYSENGQILRILVIPIKDCVNGFLHAQKLHSGLFLISYSGEYNQNGLSLVDGYGHVLKSVSETEGLWTGLDVPCFFAVDEAGSILLVDKNNRRVLLFSDDLERSVELVTRYNGLHFPLRVCLDERNGRMFVADNWFDFRDKEYRNGRVLVFQVNNVLKCLTNEFLSFKNAECPLAE